MTSLMVELPGIIWLLLPLLGATGFHAAVLRFDWFAILKYPIDAGFRFRGRRLFGANKTWRGIFAVACGAAIVFAVQAELLHEVSVFRQWECFDYGKVNGLALGFLLGMAAEFSELPNSFVKRQLNITPGSPATGHAAAAFFIWDQIDILLGYWLVLAAFMEVSLLRVLLSIALVLAIHPLLSVLGLMLGVRRTAR